MSKGPTTETRAHWIEWATGLTATILVVAMIGWVAYDAATGTHAEPELVVTITAQRPAAGGTQVSFTISNTGKRSAAGVPVTGLLVRDGIVKERREVTFDYVPAQSHEDGVLIFTEDPSGAQIDLHASGYRDP
ncbi:TIGR02588 family protein [Xaviernesmea oryzae]|uniref:TIGR02588 family protein n=1 Tax=Xaviernesmea oryzae TaxID=464029 RepID=A0A1Q9ARQ0_9HYPH|nr:TIGR02588 family protein [Xaviernesmea oryzae]OLP58080.1 TIGR02588 family protein [Xaviernesmea oryzae]SEL83390.1 TIGR02588 family protein [Xaviernesmea oryzae]